MKHEKFHFSIDGFLKFFLLIRELLLLSMTVSMGMLIFAGKVHLHFD